MEIDETAQQQLVQHAEKQTAALEFIRGMVLVWSVFAAIGLVLWLIALVV